MGIPALDRGLQILDHLIRRRRPCKYSEIRESLDGVGDASLNRLLKSLLQSGHLEKAADGQYIVSARVRSWAHLVAGGQSVEEVIELHVTELSRLTDESAAYCTLNGDRIQVVTSMQCVDSIRIMQPGGLLHYESDHAAALAILDQVDDEEVVRSYVEGDLSRTESWDVYLRDREAFRVGSMFADRARLRLGVTRCAAGVACNGRPGALFLCLPTLRFDRDRAMLLAQLNKSAEQLKVDLARVK